VEIIIPPNQEFLPTLIFPIAIMITLKLGLNSCFTKLPNLIILSSLILIKILEAFLPIWFSRWWMRFGLVPEILPFKLIEAFNSFKTHDYGSKFPLILHFVRKFKIPWILKWQYIIMDAKVERHWYVKWWDKYTQVEIIVNNVKELAQAPGAQTLIPNASPLLLTPSAFLPPLIYCCCYFSSCFFWFFEEKVF
jgi:hypothetical protein